MAEAKASHVNNLKAHEDLGLKGVFGGSMWELSRLFQGASSPAPVTPKNVSNSSLQLAAGTRRTVRRLGLP